MHGGRGRERPHKKNDEVEERMRPPKKGEKGEWYVYVYVCV